MLADGEKDDSTLVCDSADEWDSSDIDVNARGISDIQIKVTWQQDYHDINNTYEIRYRPRHVGLCLPLAEADLGFSQGRGRPSASF